jgi:hypothetical protein
MTTFEMAIVTFRFSGGGTPVAITGCWTIPSQKVAYMIGALRFNRHAPEL